MCQHRGKQAADRRADGGENKANDECSNDAAFALIQVGAGKKSCRCKWAEGQRAAGQILESGLNEASVEELFAHGSGENEGQERQSFSGILRHQLELNLPEGPMLCGG